MGPDVKQSTPERQAGLGKRLKDNRFKTGRIKGVHEIIEANSEVSTKEGNQNTHG